MRLENLALEAPRMESDKVYQLVDLAYVSPASLYGSGDVQLGGGKCIPRFNSGVGTSGYFTALKDDAATPDLSIKTSTSSLVGSMEGRFQLDKNNIEYRDSKGWMGGLYGLQNGEMNYLKKLRDKDL